MVEGNDKTVFRLVLNTLIALMLTISTGLSAWTLSRVVEHEKAIAIIVATLSKLPATYPPQDYRDLLNERFNRVYEELKQNREIMVEIRNHVSK